MAGGHDPRGIRWPATPTSTSSRTAVTGPWSSGTATSTGSWPRSSGA